MHQISIEPPDPQYRDVEEAISELERELRIREGCYGRWISDGKLSKVEARDRLARLRAALHHLERLNTAEGHKLAILDGARQAIESWSDTARPTSEENHAIDHDTRKVV